MLDSRPLIKFLSRHGETKDTRNLDDLDWDEMIHVRFARHHFDAAPIGPVDYENTADKVGLLIGGASDKRESST